MHQPTDEMTAIYKAASLGKSFICEAKAGAGKTTTVCNIIRNESTKKKILYICFNTHNIADAKDKLKGVDVTVTNVHKMAFAAIGIKYQKKINNMSFAKYSYLLKTKDHAYTRAVREAISEYFCSLDTAFSCKHILTTNDRNEIARIKKGALYIINQMIDIDNHDVKISHDAYLHLFCTTQIGLKVWQEYDLIIVDESQDQNLPVVALEKMFLSKGGQLIKVGDEEQALYRFRKAVNANSEFKGILPFFSLSKSFRFSENIAELAKMILKVKGKHDVKFDANRNITTNILPPGTKINEARVILHRTAAGVIRTAIELMCRKLPFNVVSGLRSYVTSELYWFEAIKLQRSKVNIPKYFLKAYPDWSAVKEIAKAGLDPDVSRIVKIFEICTAKGFNSIDELLSAVDTAEHDEISSLITLTTVHRYKGSEHNNVILSNDYKTLKELKKLRTDDLVDEINNLYVAITRAKQNLVLNDVVQEIMLESATTSRYV
ncbi:hypothetical protein UA32_12395 [Photobacterium angustum]|uniref:ATP-dependent helicase n=1 Tax=Photobacterium angustum TaxID=661 RepID=A0ABX5H1S1_PHOAN|nr:UvrD-helicase domain-containing protein [Photobacterium angustum]KJG37747.1 hypothetical protein UA32_12395 [Photobacterium angustum]PSX07014.1 ATP-dependent helicase [Photobacterium angustum]